MCRILPGSTQGADRRHIIRRPCWRYWFIGAEDAILREQRFQHGRDMCFIDSFENEVGSIARPITSYEYWHLLAGQAALAGLSAPLACRTAESFALPLVRAQEVGLVSFSDTDERVSLYIFGQREEPMAPTESRTHRDVQTLRDLVQRQSVTQRSSLVKPLTTHVQSRQWRAGQGTERLATAATLVPL